jgi:hypothetical protein
MILGDHRAASYRKETPRACAVRKIYRVVNLAEERRTEEEEEEEEDSRFSKGLINMLELDSSTP